MTREEAIRKLQKQKAEYLEEWVDFSGVAEAYDMAIEALSAESAQPEIIRCKDCKYQSKGANDCESWNLCEYRSWLHIPIDDEDFCSYAERRTDG